MVRMILQLLLVRTDSNILNALESNWLVERAFYFKEDYYRPIDLERVK